MQVEFDIDFRTEDQAVGRSAEVEHAGFLSFFAVLSLKDRDFAGRDLFPAAKILLLRCS